MASVHGEAFTGGLSRFSRRALLRLRNTLISPRKWDCPLRAITVVAVVVALAGQYAARAWGDPDGDARKAYDELLSATEWQQAKRATAKLAALGETGLPFIIKGTKHESVPVRWQCYNTLSETFPKHPKSIQAVIAGLDDTDPGISCSCAFDLGDNRVAEAKDVLNAYRKTVRHGSKARFAALKSLAEIGQKDVILQLFVGLGSDTYYERELANIGVKAMCGKDLTDFGYEGPREGYYMGFHGQGFPIVKAKRRRDRCQAVLDFAVWLKKERPDLFKELDKIMEIAYPNVTVVHPARSGDGKAEKAKPSTDKAGRD